MWLKAVLCLFGLLLLLPARAATLVPSDSTWRFFRGYYEASSPDTAAWRQQGFDDSFWEVGQSSFYFENQPNSANAYTGNTVLADMYGVYSCVFLRTSFYVSNLNDVAALQVAGFCDDGFIAWINGEEVARFNMPTGSVAYNGFSSPALAEPISWWTNSVTNFRSFLLPGTNILAVQAYNATLSSSDFIIRPALYYVSDTAVPKVSLVYPGTNAVVRQLNSVEVGFNEVVTGVDAADLLINGLPATEVAPVTPSSYLFSFLQPATGTVQVAFAPGHGIRDASNARNLFGGAAWSYTLNPNAPLQDIIISEFMASNSGSLTNSLHDELGNSPDWIELYNGSASAVDLLGWGLTDDAAEPLKWRFPSTVLPANSYLVIFASGRDTNVFGRLHTSFKLSASTGYLALADPGGNVISAFVPTYPQQYEDVSYGRDRLDATLLGYYTNATPGAANATRGPGFGPEVHFSQASGAFQTTFYLNLSVADTNYDIRYVVLTTNVTYGTAAVTNIPTAASTLYTAPILVGNTMQVRARAFPRVTGQWPGPPATCSYVRIAPALAAFTSDRPVVLLHNLAGGTLSSSSPSLDQSVILMTFEPFNGRTSLTNPPTLVSRAGFNIRGSSTAGLPQYNLAVETWDEYNQDNKVELLGMPAESDWVFYAQDGFDPSFLHNPLMHQLRRDSGGYSARTRFAEVFLNTYGGQVTYAPPVGGDYFGLYTIEEKVKRGDQRVDIANLEPQVTNAPAISGGYLLKIDRADANERTFYDSYVQQNLIYQDPPGLEMVTAARRPQVSYISNYFRQFGTALWGTSYTDPLVGYAAYIDVDSWVENHIFNVLAFNVDAFRLSGYFFKDRDKKIEMGPMWDFDRSLGTSYSGDVRCFNPRLWRVQSTGDQGTDYFGNPSYLGVRWWQRLFTDPDFWQRWVDRWGDLRQGVLSTNHIFAVVSFLTNQLAQAQPRQSARWSAYSTPRAGTVSANGYTHTFAGNYAGEIAFLKRWISDRVNFIDTNFLQAPVFSGNGGPISPGYTLTITATSVEAGTQIAYTLDGTDPRAPGGSTSPSAQWGYSPLFLNLSANARVVARAYNPLHSNVTGGIGTPPISTPWSAPTAATFVVATPSLAITEIMYAPPAPVSGTNSTGDFEFIELKNVGSDWLYLPGIRFTNGIDFTFSITNDIAYLEPGGYLVLVRNRAAFLSRYPGVANIAGQYSGKLDGSGERLYLEGALREPILNFAYNDAWYPVTAGAGFSLVIRNEAAPFWNWTNAASWRASAAVLGSPGQADPAAPSFPAVVINEVLTHTDPPQVDAIELYNPGPVATNIGGWFLTDDENKPMKYVIAPGTTLGANGYLQFTETQFGAGSNSFALSSLGEEAYLYSGNGTNLTGYRHGFKFGAQINGVTFGRYVTSDGREHLATEITNTLGRANLGPKVGPVVINEIFYAPPALGLNADTGDEFIELKNTSAQSVALYDVLHATNAWRLDGAVQYTFPADVVVPPFGYVVVVPFDPVWDPFRRNWFSAVYGMPTNTLVFGPWAGALANEGERVGLYLPDKPEIPPSPLAGLVPYVLVEGVHYSNSSPWPTDTCETGNSLGRKNGLTFADEPTNWQAGRPSPGGGNQGAINADSDNDGLPDEWEIAYGLNPNDPNGDNGPLGDPDHDGMNNWQEYIAGTSPMNASDAFRFEYVGKAGNYCLLQFPTRVGRKYQIEVRDSLTGTWSVYLSNITGTGSAYSVYDPLGSTSRYYRVRATWAP